MPRTGMNPEELKERALDLALQRMRQQGFEKVRLVDIAKDLGVSHAALYPYFQDRSALLDAVSERWLVSIDTSLAKLVESPGDPVEKIRQWVLELHRAKLEKVRADAEGYKAFNLASDLKKPFIMTHLKNSHDQLLNLVLQLREAWGSLRRDPEEMVQIIISSTVAFHYPRLVAERMDENREEMLDKVVTTILRGFEN